MKKQLFNLDVEYTFRGTFVVRAQTPMEAREMVGARCGMTIGGGIHTTLDEKDVDWKFPVHPKMEIKSIKSKR